MNLEKEFIPYEQAVALKELGFKEECFGGYIRFSNGSFELAFYKDRNVNFNTTSNIYVSAPTFAQAFKFFREKKLLGLVNPIDDWNSWSFSILAEDCMSPFFEIEHGDEYKSYEEAELACLVKLIELVKSK